MKSKILSVLALSAGLVGWASEPLTLTFERTGTDASSVTVTTGLEGVTATLTSVSHALKASDKAVGSENLCADVNGSSSPTIVYTFAISGLPTDWSANNLGLDITAYKENGAIQTTDDNLNRHFNVKVDANNTQIAGWTNLDPANGVTNARKVWDQPLISPLQPGSNLNLVITVTKGDENKGCFFSLNSIILKTVENTESKIYTIKWKNNTNSYMTALPDGSIQIGGYSTSNAVFWEFIPTNKDNCYYIRNTATQMYVGSCNMEPSSSSRVSMSTEPVEYYVHLSAAESGDNKDCYWMSSTDCANYSSENANARCLNKDGGSNYIITWKSGVSNVGSYWTLTESDDLYEVHPFATGIPYYIFNSEGKVYNHSGQWVTYDMNDLNARWIFEGTDNISGGYKILNATSEEAINNGTRYKVYAGTAGYYFADSEGNRLTFDGVDTYIFTPARNRFAQNFRLVAMPCGGIGDTWITSVASGDFHYPMATANNGTLTNGTVTGKPAKYVILSRDAILAVPGSTINLAITLNKVPSEQYTLTAFADFDRDGHFEYSVPVTIGQNCSVEIAVPESAALGDCRLRLRLNSNGMQGPDDEIYGEVLDLRLNVATVGSELIDPVVKPNDPKRGDAVWANNVATATAKGNAMFLYWKDGARIVSTNADHNIEPAVVPHVLTAYFSVNTDELDGIDPVILNKVNSDAAIVFNGSEISVTGAEPSSIIVFALNGHVAASTTSKTLNVANLPGGVYITKAITTTGIVSSKIVK